MPDEDRALLMEHDAQVCRQCGNLVSECSDPALDWHPHTSTCYASASVAWGRRRLDEKHEDAKPAANALHPLDGVSVYASQTPPPAGEDPFA